MAEYKDVAVVTGIGGIILMLALPPEHVSLKLVSTFVSGFSLGYLLYKC
mgnify:CR=1 FL=1